MVVGFKNVVLPIDFSEHCDRAIAYATWFAQVSGATVHLVHVVANPADLLYEPLEVPYWGMVEHAEKKARTLLEAVAQQSLPADCPRQVHVRDGDPYPKLMEVVESIDADLIVVSTHGRGGISHLVMGSVAEKILRYSTCPVLVVRREE